MKDVLIVGSGGREHALAWKLRQSPQVGRIYVAPGNPGTEDIAENIAIESFDVSCLLGFAKEVKPDLTVIGSELSLILGVVDSFQSNGLNIFGPSQAAASLETSKIWAKLFMWSHQIPTATFRLFHDFDVALNHVKDRELPVVIKADGLAAGKGVVVCDTLEQAEEALCRILVDKVFGEMGVVIEDKLVGQEVSILAFCDSDTAVPMITVQDHKTIFDGGKGPNTGGMGCYAPVPFVSFTEMENIVKTILQPTVQGMRKQGTPFRGVLYVGLMLTEEGPKVLEYNVRLGDPETQVILPLLNTDLLTILQACVDDTLDEVLIQWLPEACVCVVCASQGYPGSYQTGGPITGLGVVEQEGTMIFHAGTQREGENIVTAGGRVLGVTCRAPDLSTAIDQAYSRVRSIHFDGMYYRRDIGAKALSLKEG